MPSPRPRRTRSVLARTAAWIAAALVLVSATLLTLGWEAFGHRATGARRARMERSPEWKDGHFVNPEPLHNELVRGIRAGLAMSPDARPHAPVPVAAVNARAFDTLPASGLRVTWFGHSTTLVEIDSTRVLTDPVWSERVGPFTWIGPTRFFPPLIAIDSLPAIDAVVVSHDHYDHLDRATILALRDRTRAIFIVPLGVGAHLEYWGVPLTRIVELDWWQSVKVHTLTITATPARHASGRTLWDKDATLWAGYALTGNAHRVFYSGDTGLFPALNDIGARLGPFDVAMIEVGQYNQAWPDWHSGPEQAVNASQRVGARTMLPVHWALFTLAPHAWTEPGERALAAAQSAGVTLLTPRPGAFTFPNAPAEPARWWPVLPWHTATQDPIVSTELR